MKTLTSLVTMKFLIFTILFTLAFAFLDDDIADFGSFGDEKEPPVVETLYGKLKGEWDESFNGKSHAKFEGVPYAQPPVGELRFQAPRTLKPWKGIRNTMPNQEQCLQYDPVFEQVSGKEDCLLLNVYSPRVDAAAALPVIIYIHGGAFMSGAGFHYDPSFLMDWEMVVVTINYRLGPLGFLSTQDELAPGNAGLKDQVMALRWVKENIKAFGGNPDSITVIGGSAGAASLHYLYLSPLAKGLFNRGIAWSGSALSPWAYSNYPVSTAKRLASLIDCPTDSNRLMVDCLTNKPAEDVVNATTKMFPWKLEYFTEFVPTTEPELEGAFLTKHPYEAMMDGDMYDAPLIATVVADEGLYPAAAFLSAPDEYFPEIEKNWRNLVPHIFSYEDTLAKERRDDVAVKIREEYLGNKAVANETFDQLVDAMGDRMFTYKVGKMAEIQAAKSKSPVYMYRYSYRGEKSVSFAFTYNYNDYGVAHGDDIFHVFYAPFITSTSKPDLKMTKMLINMIYTFARNETPRLTKEAPEWQPLTPGDSALNILEISSPNTLEMKTDSDFGRRSFWDSLGFNEDQNYKDLPEDVFKVPGTGVKVIKKHNKKPLEMDTVYFDKVMNERVN